MFLSKKNTTVGGNFFKDLTEGNLFTKKISCTTDDKIMKLSYNKSSCMFIDIYNNYNKNKVIEYLKKIYTNKYDNVDDNIINIYCKLFMPLNIVLDNKNYLNKVKSDLIDMLVSININFITLDYFSLNNIYLNNKDIWYNIYKKHRKLYKTFSKKNYEDSMKNFLLASLNPIHSNIYNKLYYYIENKISIDNNNINKIKNENEKELYKLKTFKEFFEINKIKIKQELLFENYDSIKNLNKTEMDNGFIINNLLNLINYIIKNDKTKLDDFINDLIIFKLKINNTKYNLLFDDFNKKLLNKQYIYNNLCKNPYFNSNILSCPSKISVNLEESKIYSCNDTVKNVAFKNLYNKNNKCNNCSYSINECKINLECKDNLENDKSYLEIDPNKKNVNLIQNRCLLNASIQNLDKNKYEEEIRNQEISDYNKKFILNKPLCTKTTLQKDFGISHSEDTFINHITTYIKNNNIYNYLYLRKTFIDTISNRYTDRLNKSYMNKDNKSIGYIILNKNTVNGPKQIVLHYLFNPNNVIKNNNEKYHLTEDNKNIITNVLNNKKTTSIDKKIRIKIGKKGLGGIYNNGINTCPTRGGDTIISFPVAAERNYDWYMTDKRKLNIIAYGGNVGNISNSEISKNIDLLIKYSENNKGTQHMFYNRNNICAGSGGATINQLKDEFKLTSNNKIEEKANKFNRKELFTMDNGEKYYLYQKNNSLNSYSITNNKEEIISYPRGGNGGSLKTMNGNSSASFGCGGGSGAKKIYEPPKESNFGNGGDGKEGAVMSLVVPGPFPT